MDLTSTRAGVMQQAGRVGRLRLTQPSGLRHHIVDGEDTIDPRRAGAGRAERLVLVCAVPGSAAKAIADAKGVLVVAMVIEFAVNRGASPSGSAHTYAGPARCSFTGQLQRGEVRTVIVNTHDQSLQVTTIADESENYTVAYPDTPDVMGLLRKHPSVSVVVRTPNGQAAWRCWPYLLLPLGLLVTFCALGVIVVRLLRSGLDASSRERDELEERLADLQHRDRRVENSS